MGLGLAPPWLSEMLLKPPKTPSDQQCFWLRNVEKNAMSAVGFVLKSSNQTSWWFLGRIVSGFV